MTEYEPIIGLEVHAQLRTRSKMYCACPADYQDAEPNTRTCPVCLGLPGSLPVINREAIRSIIMIGLALHCRIAEHTKFDRKNYAYPDLMKGYQISQYDLPLCADGHLDIEIDGEPRRIRVERIHMEEDVAKLAHRTDPATGEPYSLADVNRSGVPLVEMVSRPDIRSPEEARQCLASYHAILRYLGVSTANMDEGSFRCDANVSIRPKGDHRLGSKVEVKNMNSFRSVFRAIEHEIARQTALLNSGGRIPQETRGWLEHKGVTTSLRSKEEANDYRYFPEPDLPPLNIDPKWVAELAELLPELPEQRKTRFIADYQLPPYDAALLTASPHLADYYETAVASLLRDHPAAHRGPKALANWTITELGRLANEARIEIHQSPVTPQLLAGLIPLIDNGTIGAPQAKTVIEEMFRTGKPAPEIVNNFGLAQISDSDELRSAVAQAIADNEQATADYLAGKETAAKFLVGQVMKATRGKANPSIVAQLIIEQLSAAKPQ